MHILYMALLVCIRRFTFAFPNSL